MLTLNQNLMPWGSGVSDSLADQAAIRQLITYAASKRMDKNSMAFEFAVLLLVVVILAAIWEFS